MNIYIWNYDRLLKYLIRTNFRGHLISRISNTNISRALIFAILQKLINIGHLISRKLTKDRLRKPIIDKYKEFVLANYKEPELNGHFDDCTKDVLKELYVQEEEMSDSEEKSAEVEDK